MRLVGLSSSNGRDLMVEKTEIKAGEYDLLVGIPSYNEADSIGFVVKQIDDGLKKHYSHLKTAIVNVDNNSPDGTKQVFLNTQTTAEKIYISTEPGLKGKGRNFYNLFHFTKQVKAKAVVVVDADLRSITPDWIYHLGEHALTNYDFVSPIYLRHKYDGTITNSLVYPLLFSLVGKNIRQPIGGDFAFSGRLAEHWLKQDWKESTHMYGIDNFMTLHAVFGGFNVCQTGLGVKDHKPSAPKLGQMFLEVVDTLFENLLRNIDSWQLDEITEETNKYGFKDMVAPKDLSMEELGIDLDSMKKNTTELFNDYKYALSAILEPELFSDINEMFVRGNIDMSSEMWAKTVYDFLTAFYHAGSEKLKVVEYLKPLYFMRSISFIQETKDMSSEDAEMLILKQAQIFRELKPYLLTKLEQRTKLIL